MGFGILEGEGVSGVEEFYNESHTEHGEIEIGEGKEEEGDTWTGEGDMGKFENSGQ